MKWIRLWFAIIGLVAAVFFCYGYFEVINKSADKPHHTISTLP